MNVKMYKQVDQKITSELNALESLCKQHDGYSIPIYWDLLKNYRENARDFYIYDQDQLIGYFSAFSFSENEFEISAMIHPHYRRQGIFSTHLREVQLLAAELEVERFTFVCPKNLTASKAALTAIGARYHFTEYTLRLLNDSVSLPPSTETTTLIEAGPDDCQVLAALDAKCFNSNETLMLQRFNEIISDTHRRTWLFMLENKPIGKIHLRIENGIVILHDLCILPEHQGFGYGFQMLQDTLRQLRVMRLRETQLTVNAHNENALRLYQKAGFEIQQVYEYYKLDV